MRLMGLNTLVVATDLTTTSDAAIRSAGSVAAATGATLHVATVASESTGVIAESGKRVEFLEEMDRSVRRSGLEHSAAYVPHVLEGDAAEALAALADRLSADVIITGRRRSPLRDVPLGSTARAIVLRSRVPALAIATPLRVPVRQVVVATDYSKASRGALIAGLSWASALRDRAGESRLTAIHVEEGSAASIRAEALREVEHELSVLRRGASAWTGVQVSGMVRAGTDAAGVIAALATELEADLVVVCTCSRDARSSLGSVSARLLGLTATPILLVPPAVWRDHVRDMDYF